MGLMDYKNAHRMLSKYGIKIVEGKYVSDVKEAISFSKGTPIAMKAISEKALHKSKNKLVGLNLASEDAITKSYNELSRKAKKFRPYKILAQKMITDGTEIIIGGKTDTQFGKMILIGLGGIYVETFKDFALRLCPINRYDAESMLQQLRSKRIIAPDSKTSGLVVNLLLNVSRMFTENNITELDLNPLILHDGTYDAVDLRIIR